MIVIMMIKGLIDKWVDSTCAGDVAEEKREIS
jgi:hypothetical protein